MMNLDDEFIFLILMQMNSNGNDNNVMNDSLREVTSGDSVEESTYVPLKGYDDYEIETEYESVTDLFLQRATTMMVTFKFT